MKNDILMISTFIDSRMIKILLDSLIINKSVKLHLVLLAQRGLDIDISKYTSELNDISIVKSENGYGLSQARNICMDYIMKHNIVADYVMFPDDDCFFSSDFFSNFREETKDKLPYIIASYGTNTKTHIIKTNCNDGDKLYRKSYNIVASINLLVPYFLFEQVGKFDEILGVGAKYGAGEDADYYFRCFKYIDYFIYTDKLFNYHPLSVDKNKEMTLSQLMSRYIKYGNGVIYLFYKHKMIKDAFYLCFKALCGCLISLFKLDFRMSYVYFIVVFTRSYMLAKLICNMEVK